LSVTTAEIIVRKLSLDSHLMVERDVGVTTRRDGVIESVLAERGQRVTEGLPLAMMDRGDLLLSEKASELDLAKEQSSFERARRLSEQKIVSDEDYELARLRRDAAEKGLQQIRYELEKCVIRAPFDGVVSGRFVEKGQVIQQDDRRTLFQVTALSPLLARVYVPEWALFGLREGQRARVMSPAAHGGGSDVEARVRWINDVVDAASGSVEVLVEILERADPAVSAGLRPGMSVKVQLELSLVPARGRALVSVPRELFGPVEPSPGERVELSVLDAAGEVRKRSVVIGFVGDTLVEIRDGLSPGAKVLAVPPIPQFQ